MKNPRSLRGWFALRFKILERDNFSCRYCGQFAPNVMLEVDHVTPVCEGGTDSEDNLVAACRACNRGKEALRMKPAPKGNKRSNGFPVGGAKERILSLLEQQPASAAGISDALGLDRATTRSRLSNLKAAGLVERGKYNENGHVIWHRVP